MDKEALMYFDGGIRKGIMACAFIIDSVGEEKVLSSGQKTCGKGDIASSNIAEYRGLIYGLQEALKIGIDIIHIHGDSQLVVKQITGTFKTRKQTLIDHRNYVLELLEHFENYTIKWIPRLENKRADFLVNEVFKRRNGKCSKKRRS